MGSVKISELNEMLVISNDDFIPIVDSGSGTTYRVTFNVFNDWMTAFGSASHANIADFAWLANTASYCESSSYSLHAVSSSYSDTASYYDISEFIPVNAINAVNAETASCLQGIGTSWEQDLQISSSLKISGSAYLALGRKRDVQGEGDTKNCIFFHYEIGTDDGKNDWTRIYYAEDVTDSGRMVFEHGDNVDALLPSGPNIDIHGVNSPGFLWQTCHNGAFYATGSLMFLKTDGKLYVRAVEANAFSASFNPNQVGFYGTASQAISASYLIGGAGSTVEPPIGAIMDFAGTGAPADANWKLCDGSELSQAGYPILYALLGTTWGTAAAGNFKLPDFRKRITFGSDGSLTKISGSVGEYGGSEALSTHWHATAGTDQGHTYYADDDNLMLPMFIKNINPTTHLPQQALRIRNTTPMGYRGYWYISGDNVQNVQPAGQFNSTQQTMYTCTSYPLHESLPDMMPPYAVTNKIIRVS